jgi:RHH-type proline utilization regulon transcriptional repressor/proline dehydrogenase/delta 1-pyrroline-5-carboxylate dehydrogenase
VQTGPEPPRAFAAGTRGLHCRAWLDAAALASANPIVTEILRPELPAAAASLRERVTAAWLRDETEHVNELLAAARLSPQESSIIERNAAGLVERVRGRATDQGVIEAFMREYDLSSEEGVLLMCVAEALLRIPDQATADKLIRDKLGEADWEAHLGKSDSVLVNASSWGLLLTGKMVGLSEGTRRSVGGALKRLIGRAGEPVIRLAVRQAMRIMGHQFVMGRSIGEALSRSLKGGNTAYRYSFDMLGEAAFTARDAARYFEAYRQAILAIGASGPAIEGNIANVLAAPSISVKLSALHPRYEHGQRERVHSELIPRVLELAQLARSQAIGFTIDAEEADRLELSLDVIVGAFVDPSLNGWNGYGLAVQAYQKRAPFVLDVLIDTARRIGRQMPVRLVKGAYWDSEIKRAQVDGLPGYPVLTRKPNTDVSYLACAKKMLDAGDVLYPMFATHNAHTISAIHRIAQGRPYEYQKLHGMGDDLYAEVIGRDKLDVPCRVYAPVGSHEDLLPYLVRRLLENGANSSFINRITDETIPARELVTDPVAVVSGFASKPHPNIPLPIALYGADRINSMGINLADDLAVQTLVENIKAAVKSWTATPLVPGSTPTGAITAVDNPADRNDSVGQWQAADAATVERALANAVKAQPDWDAVAAADRAAILERAADLMEARMPELIALCMREAGKTMGDGLDEVREAVDFCRYYAQQARRIAQPEHLLGPTGESNRLQLHGRGVFACISPWNFPLAIFVGQIAAALVTGNAVLAKPAEQTTLIGCAAVKLLHEAGVPESVLQFLPGDGATIGAALTSDPRVTGVAFTGSTDTARAINRAMAARDAAIGVLIAETGGQNAMIADSSALPEQLVKDAMTSAFSTAGQRCSAARVLFVQSDIADKVIGMLAGAMDELKVGNPGDPGIDVGPLIDADALNVLAAHAERMDREAKLIKQVQLGEGTEHGNFFAPRAYELKSLDQLQREVFGPVLHVIRFDAADLDKVIDAINATGYGLTLGIHSRIDTTVDRIAARAKVGNCYVNRSMIGAVVGVQPFGGEGLSGTGPKAGGPNYLLRFVTERTLTVNTTAAGGNASLLTLGE